MPSEHEPPSTPVEISQCEIEPVHIPGAIQAHGVLLALHGPTLRVVQASANCQTLLGRSTGDLLERDLGITLGEPLAEAVREALGRFLNLPDAPAAFSWRLPSGDRPLSGYVHQSGELPVVEFELAIGARADSHDTTKLGEAARAARLVHAQPELSGKVEVAAEWLRRVTGYDRVMVYQFHEDYHGEVIAESRRADLKPYLGLHYPASDIPAQARRLYLVSPTRAIADVDYSPSPLVPAANPVTGRPLDLSQSLLRSVSPIHLQYLRNMGVRASLTASILRDGQLWGLVSCHHSSPRLASTATREIATWLAQDLASQIALTQDARARRYSAQLKDCRNRISVAMQTGARLRDLLHEPTLADFLGAVGADGAAVVDGLNVTTCGVTPDADRVLQLVRGISAIATRASSDLFVTDCVSQHLPEATDLAPTAAGMGVFPIDEGQSLKLVWFRGEQLRLVKWGGNPDKAVAVTPDGRLTPRLSFDVWTESVRHRSLPWRAEELESARELRAMLDLELRREAEDAVRASQVLLTDVLDSLSSHIVVLDGQGVVLAVNLAWRRFAEANEGGEATVAGVDYLAVCRQAAARPDGEEAASALQGILEVLGGARRDFRMEYPCHAPSEQRWFIMRVFRLTGTNAGAVIVHEDDTVRRLAGEVQRAAHEQLRSVIEASGDVIAMMDTEYRYTLFNAAFVNEFSKIYGKHLEPGASMRDAMADVPEDLAHSMAYWTRALKGEDFVVTQQFGQTALERNWYDLRFNPIRGSSGQIVGAVHVVRNVTERTRAAAALEESEARLAEAIDQAHVGPWKMDGATSTFTFTDRFYQIYGTTAEREGGYDMPAEVYAREFLLPTEAPILSHVARLLGGEADDVELEHRIRRRDGEIRDVVVRVTAIRDETGRVVGTRGANQDVTDQRRTERALRQSEEKYSALFSITATGVVVTDESGQIVEANPAAQSILGLTRSEALARTYDAPAWFIVRPDGTPMPADEYASVRAMRERQTVEGVEMGVRRPDGSIRWMLTSASPIPVEGLGVSITFTDITERRRTEETLRQSETRFRNLFESHSAVMLLLDPASGEIVDANPAAARFYGYDRVTLKTMQIGQFDTVPQGELERSLASAATGAQTTHAFSHRLADGEVRRVDIDTSPVEVDGHVLLFSIVQDTTSRLQALEALERERKRYLSFMNIAQDGIHLLDESGTLVEANRAFLQMLGQPPDAVGRLHLGDWEAAIPREQLKTRLLALLNEPGIFETRHRRIDGTVFDVEVHAGAVELEGKRYVLAASRDITARKAFNRALEERVSRAVAEVRTKDQLLITQGRQAAMGEMIGNIAHQWRQPLNALGLVLVNLQDSSQAGELEARGVDDAVERAGRLIQKMSSTIDVFSNFFKPEKQKHAFSALAQVREIVALLEASFTNAGITVAVHAAEDVTLFGFSNEYFQVLLNLLSNARQAIQGTKVVAGQVTVWLGIRDGLGCLTVRDNGGGVPEAFVDRIFELYFSTKEGGSGIGLYMSRQIAEQSLGGRLDFSNVADGTEFTLFTPLADKAP